MANAINAGQELDVRESHVWIRSKSLGTFRLGRSSQATDGIMELSLSEGASNASTMGFSLSPFQQHIFRQAGVGVTNPFDGTRKSVVSYQTPRMFEALTAMASWESGNASWDAALRYAGEFGGIRVAAGIGYRHENNVAGTLDRKFVGGSASIKHVATGLFLDGDYGKSDGPQTLQFGGTFGGQMFVFNVPVGNASTKRQDLRSAWRHRCQMDQGRHDDTVRRLSVAEDQPDQHQSNTDDDRAESGDRFRRHEFVHISANWLDADVTGVDSKATYVVTGVKLRF